MAAKRNAIEQLIKVHEERKRRAELEFGRAEEMLRAAPEDSQLQEARDNTSDRIAEAKTAIDELNLQLTYLMGR